MTQTMTQIQCPSCKSPIHAPLEQLIDVGDDASAKARLLSGSLNRVQCPACGFEGQISSPLVYHDPEHELLLTYFPIELNVPKNEQERIIGKIINQAVNRLPPEKKKGYLFQPQSIFTMQGFIERILEADGITKDEIEAQRARMRLFEDLVNIPEDKLETFISEHDDELDEMFFQLASLTLQATKDPQAREAVNHRIQQGLIFSSYGQKIQAQEAELQAAVESLGKVGADLSREDILELLVEAPSDDRVVALVNLIRPALDYSFFMLLAEQIDSAEGNEQELLSALRERILDLTQQIDKLQEARVARSASLLKSIVEAQDLDQALQSALPLIDDLFISILQANIQAAKEGNDQEKLLKLETIDIRIKELILQSLPQGIQYAQEILSIDDEDDTTSLLEDSPDRIDDQFLGALIATAERLEEAEDRSGAERVRRLFRQALRLSMKAKLHGGKNTT